MTGATINNHPTFRFDDIRVSRNREGARLFDDTKTIFTYNGRGALYQLLTGKRTSVRQTVLLPAFHCPTVVDPVLKAGFQPRFYAIKSDLSIDEADFLKKLDKDVTAAIVINYIGFPSNLSALKAPCRDADVMLIEDCAHSFLLTNPLRLAGDRADAAVFSFKKLVPSKVGGGIRLNRLSLDLAGSQRRAPSRDSVVNCKDLLQQAVDNMDGGMLRSLAKSVEKLRSSLKSKNVIIERADDSDRRQVVFDYPFDQLLAASKLPWYAQIILASAQFGEIANVRRRNFNLMLKDWQHNDVIKPVFDQLPPEVCPWAFPVFVRDRSKIDLKLRSEGVPLFTFGETLHNALQTSAENDREMIETARSLSSSVLCFSIHQGIKPHDIDRYLRIIKSHIGKSPG